MDYSKWDSLDCDDDEEDKPRGPPRVTRLEGPARVTIGGTGAAAVSTLQPPTVQAPAAKKGATDYSKWDSLGVSDDGDSDEDEDEDDEEDPHARAYMASRAKPPPGYMVKPGQGEPAHAKPSQAPAPAMAPSPGPGTGAAVSASAAPPSHESLLAQLTRNGARREAYLWRQTETEVELSVLVPPGTRAKQMLVEVRRPQSLATDERARVVVALRGSAAMSETRWLGLRPAGSPEALSQRQSLPQAALSSGQPRPISRAGGSVRPDRAIDPGSVSTYWAAPQLDPSNNPHPTLASLASYYSPQGLTGRRDATKTPHTSRLQVCRAAARCGARLPRGACYWQGGRGRGGWVGGGGGGCCRLGADRLRAGRSAAAALDATEAGAAPSLEL